MLKRRTLLWLVGVFAVLAVVAVVLAFTLASGTGTWLLVAGAVAMATASIGLYQQVRAGHYA
jgi:hypothetical protein